MVVDYLLLCDAYWDTAAASDIVLYDLVYDRFSDRMSYAIRLSIAAIVIEIGSSSPGLPVS